MDPEIECFAAHAAALLTPEEVADLAAVPALLRDCTDEALMDRGRRAAVQRDRAMGLLRSCSDVTPYPGPLACDVAKQWLKATTWATAAADEMRRRWPEAFDTRLH